MKTKLVFVTICILLISILISCSEEEKTNGNSFIYFTDEKLINASELGLTKHTNLISQNEYATIILNEVFYDNESISLCFRMKGITPYSTNTELYYNDKLVSDTSNGQIIEGDDGTTFFLETINLTEILPKDSNLDIFVRDTSIEGRIFKFNITID